MHNHSQDATDSFSGPGGASAPAPTLPPSTSGSVRLRVRYCECDPMNVAHHASYIAWLEIGRTELLRTSGVSYADLEKAGVFLVVAKLEVKYRRPIRYDDVVEVRSTWVGGSRVKIEHKYEVAVIERGGKPDDHIAAIASTTLACVDREGKIQELPRWLTPK